MLLALAFVGSESLGTHDHILLFQIWDFPFRRLLRLAGLRRRYSTPPPHGLTACVVDSLQDNSSARTPRKAPSSVVTNTCLLAPYLAMAICEPHRKYLLRHWFYCCVCVFRELPRNGSIYHNMFLQNLGKLLPVYTASHPHSHDRGTLRFHSRKQTKSQQAFSLNRHCLACESNSHAMHGRQICWGSKKMVP
jgi:hypothetical protein